MSEDKTQYGATGESRPGMMRDMGRMARVVKTLVSVGDFSDRIVQSAAGILARHIQQRCPAAVVTAGESPATVELAVRPGVGAEGFTIADGPQGTVHIVGNDPRGVLYGVGKFLRSSRYDRGGFTPGTWRGVCVPRCPIRGIYLSTHFGNFYESASRQEVERYIEDLSLWGTNFVLLHFPHWQYASYDDPAARKMIEHLRWMMQAAKRVGMKVCISESINEGFTATPKEFLSTPVPDPLVRHGNFGVNLCPSKPAARELLLKTWDRLLDEFADPGVDFAAWGPYDEGGCGCKDCWPWGARGYVSLSRDITALLRKKCPHIKIIVSTWTFDTPPAGEWEGLSEALAEDNSWADYIMADAHEDFPRYPLEKGVPGGLPLLNFPEISMWGQNPWGGYGANPLPARFQRLWNQTQQKLSGGTPYSEGIYEDIGKAICSQFYWDPNRSAMDTVKEYAAFEYSPDVADDVAGVVEILEKNHKRDQIGPSAQEAFARVERIETKLTAQARTAWRWRIFYLRALIDREMWKTRGKLEGETLKEAFAELTAIYHAENTHSMPVRPPQVQ